MIEIFLIWKLAVYIGNSAAKKGFKKPLYQVMAILLWICGELLGSALGNIILGSDSSFWLIYGIALIGALAGASIAFFIVNFLPNQQVVPGPAESDGKQKISPSQKFRQSFWIPVITIVLALSCVCVAFGGSIMFQMKGGNQQIRASNPIIGDKIDNNGLIVQPVSEISSNANVIYLGFDYENPQASKMPITIDGYIDGKQAFSLLRTINQGQVVVTLLERSEFNKGNYEVKIHIGELFLTSTSFVVK